MQSEEAAKERRRFPRWRVSGPLLGWIGRGLKVFVADVSMGGVMIEHPNVVRPGTICSLTLSLPRERVSLRCRVVRSDIYSQEAWPTGERNDVYRTGLELLELSETSQRLVSEYIESLKANIVG